uniref:Putative ovule protein n=1 Tax=Solanum chacoense TaxID=4108 RepID=A0A0V0HTL4_SOLCH
MFLSFFLFIYSLYQISSFSLRVWVTVMKRGDSWMKDFDLLQVSIENILFISSCGQIKLNIYASEFFTLYYFF